MSIFEVVKKMRLDFVSSLYLKQALRLIIFLPFLSFSQLDSLPDPDPNFMTDEYELIVLDGDTVLRSKITKDVYNKNFRKKGAPQATFSTDWMNLHWDTKIFNPYKEADPVTWPLSLSFEGQQFTMPIEGTITSRYGWRRGRPHKGIDIDLKTGDNVMVAMDGKVRFAKYYSGFGNCVVVRHNNGLETIYAHLSKILVQPNTFVYSGQVIGKGGNTGRSRGSHLHFEVRWFNQPINPEYLFDFEKTKFFTAKRIVVDKLWADPRKHRSYKKSKIVVKRPAELFAKDGISEKNSLQRSPNTNQGLSKTGESEPSFVKTDIKPNTLEKKGEYHVVVRGDTLAKIAKKYQTTVSEICQLNGISKSTVLEVGNQIKVK